MRTRALTLACPECGSSEVVYSCEPKCCFNHVCSGCTTTFQPLTRATGEFLRGTEPPDPLPECSDPTVACERCESIAVYALDDGRLVCHGCGAVLELDITEVAPG